MPNTSRDPVDHARTTRQHAGETMKDGTNLPGLIAVMLGVIALVFGLFMLASGSTTVGVIAVLVAVVVGGGGLIWLAMAHRRVRAIESRWHAEHPSAPQEQPPTS